jgi:hypothetical protein
VLVGLDENGKRAGAWPNSCASNTAERFIGFLHGGENGGKPSKPEKLLGEVLQREEWTVRDLAQRRKGDSVKVRRARRLRKETTITLSRIAK